MTTSDIPGDAATAEGALDGTVPDAIEDGNVQFLSDFLPSGWMAAENAGIRPGDTVAVWGCGPVGLFAIQSAFLMGAKRVIAIDHLPHRLDLAGALGAETVNFDGCTSYNALFEMTGGIGPHACVDAVGLEAHATVDNEVERVKVSTSLGADRLDAIRRAMIAYRSGGCLAVSEIVDAAPRHVPAGREQGIAHDGEMVARGDRA